VLWLQAVCILVVSAPSKDTLHATVACCAEHKCVVLQCVCCLSFFSGRALAHLTFLGRLCRCVLMVRPLATGMHMLILRWLSTGCTVQVGVPYSLLGVVCTVPAVQAPPINSWVICPTRLGCTIAATGRASLRPTLLCEFGAGCCSHGFAATVAS
jgi:hypothetical protein